MREREFDIVIIGSGLGGLLCGAILSKYGYKVCVLEKHHQIGGNLQTFRRKGTTFNSAMHFVGAMDKGQILNKVFSHLGIVEETGLKRLDRKHYERIYLGEDTYSHANGFEAHRERLFSYFPGEQKAIETYLSGIREIWNSTNVLNLLDFRNIHEAETQYTHVNAHGYIDGLTHNKDLKALWGVSSALYAGVPEKSPLLTHAIINYHYILSAYKFSQGSDVLAFALERAITGFGGEVRRKKEVTGFIFGEKEATGVKTADGEVIAGKTFISNIHPALTVKLVEPGRFRKAYVSRIQSLENTIGSFCVYIRLRPKSFRNIDSNVFISRTRDVWCAGLYADLPWPSACLLYTTPDPQNPEFAESMAVSAFMKYEEVIEWESTTVEKRGEVYKTFKHEKAEKLIDLVESRFPGTRPSIEDFYTATPLTFRDYTGIPEGSVYGILKDCNNPRWSYISPNTRVPNLYLTGQNSGVGLHGVLGVTVSALFTCANFMDIGILLERMRNE